MKPKQSLLPGRKSELRHSNQHGTILLACIKSSWHYKTVHKVIKQVEAQPDYGPGSEIGTGGKIGVTWSRKRSFKMEAAELGYLLTKSSFWPRCMTWYINFLAWMQRIISLVCFANNAIHPWPQVMPILDREMPPRFTPVICLRRNFVYISNLEDREDKSLDQNF